MSETAREFVSACLTIDPASRPTAAEALQHKWLASEQPHFVPDPESASGRPTNLLPNIRKAFDAKKTCMSIYIPFYLPSSARSLASLPRNNSPIALVLSPRSARCFFSFLFHRRCRAYVTLTANARIQSARPSSP